MARLLLNFALLAALSLAVASKLVYINPVTGEESVEGPRVVVLPSYGETSTSVSYFFKGTETKSTAVSRGSLYKAGRVVISTYKNYVNCTIPFVFDRSVGIETYTFSVEDVSGKTYEISGRFVVAGVVIMEKGVVVSGDDGPGVSVGSTGKYSYDVKAVGTDGATADLTAVKISYKEMAGVYMKEVRSSSIDSTTFVMELNAYRVGTGNFMVNFECPSIVKDGEYFETVLNVKQATNPAPPCVVVGGSVKMSSSGLVSIAMYNLEKPPLAAAVRAIVMSVGGQTYDYLRSTSTRAIPDQTIVFKPESLGSATLTCDGEPAKIVGGGDKLILTGTLPEGPVGALAVDKVQALEASDRYDTFTAVIRVLNTSPTEFLAKDASAIVSKMCSVIGGTRCVFEKITAGSVVMNTAGYVPKGDKAAEGKLRGSVDSCTFQKDLGYQCPEIIIEGVDVITAKAVSAATGISAAGSAGLATWTIVLIAVVGAFAIILLIMLALWAVYRRNAEQSESDYSSSGPLGVPDPSDLLYEQSIVRDIYGRGDFPEGGPTAAAAAEREREADLREEFPRPPSSSDVSRGAATDDASSTYSV